MENGNHVDPHDFQYLSTLLPLNLTPLCSSHRRDSGYRTAAITSAKVRLENVRFSGTQGRCEILRISSSCLVS